MHPETNNSDDPFEIGLLSIVLGVPASAIIIFGAIGTRVLFKSGLPPLWVIVAGGIFYWGIFICSGIEITGNLLLDSLLISLVSFWPSLAVVVGVKTFFSLWFKVFPLGTFFLLSAFMSLVFRVFFWKKRKE